MSAHHTPEEIRKHLKHPVRRLHNQARGVDPDVARLSQGFDQLGLDSQYDYDPLWRGVVPAFQAAATS
jgi:hypothetical protein